MGLSSSKAFHRANNPLQELQYQESQRERARTQQAKKKKQITRSQKKHAKKKHKEKQRKHSSIRSQMEDEAGALEREHDNLNSVEAQSYFNSHTMRYDFRWADANRQMEIKIQQQLNEDLCAFILNQMALTVQFFKNYESEVSAIAEEMLNSEEKFNHNLEEHSMILSNPLDVAVSKWICYQPFHGPHKEKVQLLQTQTMYVVFENVDIARPNDANYDSISPLCRVDIEFDFRESAPCKEDCRELLSNIKWKGYIRLRLREEPKQPKLSAENFEDIYSECSSGYGTATPYNSKKALNVSPNNKREEYDYAFISHLNTQHPLKELKMADIREKGQIEFKVLPESCVSSLGNFVKPLREEFTDDEENSETECEDSDDGDTSRDYDTLQALKLYRLELEKRRKLLAQNYLNSTEFMKYFGELVRQKLAAKLNITEEELSKANYRGTSIYTNKFELIPAIYVAQNVSDWPKCAFEFRLRNRPISINPQTGQQVQWPTKAMIKRIETFGFHVIPLGYAPKKKRNPFREIEWRIVFPKAERYLEQNLTYTQVKVYMMAKVLIKSFVEPLESNKALMFALDHLRMHLFWECERDYTAWPEEFLGEVLLRFINSFKQKVKEKTLSDYFIRERNLFESIPEYSLNNLHTILADITANPLMHLMIAFRNLKFKTGFFTTLNLKKLYENLKENDIIRLKMLSKNARSLMDLGQDNKTIETCLMPDEGDGGLQGLKHHHVRTNGKLRRKTHLLRYNIEMKKLQLQAKRLSVESIDVEFFFQRNLNFPNTTRINRGVENLRRTNILETVLDHLLEMAVKAIQFKAVVVAKIYLSQARRLCKLYHNYGCDMGAKEYLAFIHDLDERLQIIYDKEDPSFLPPSLPRRISTEVPLQIPSGPTVHCLRSNSFNLYEEMVPQESLRIKSPCNETCEQNKTARSSAPSPELRKSIKFHNVLELTPENFSSLATKCEETKFKTCLKSHGKIKQSPKAHEIRKSIKFRDKVATLDEDDLHPKQRIQGYRPASILRYNHVSQPEAAEDYQKRTDSASKLCCDNVTSADKPVSTSPFPKTSKDLLNSLPLAHSELFKSISQNANQFLNHITVDEKKAQIREMLKHKTVQLKGVFNQSSDT